MTSPRSAPRLLITAGPTREPIDSVRFISNRSSGRMGAAIASAAATRGWPTTLLLGPVGEITLPRLLGVARFITTDELAQALASRWPHHDILIMAAAVADYRPVELSATPVPGGIGGAAESTTRPIAAGAHREEKIARGAARLLLELEPTPDLLQSLAPTTRADQVTVGFALESMDLSRRATEKLRRKRLDAIVANPLQTMDAEDVEATLLRADGSVRAPTPPRLSKLRFAEWLLDEVESIWRLRVESQ